MVSYINRLNLVQTSLITPAIMGYLHIYGGGLPTFQNVYAKILDRPRRLFCDPYSVTNFLKIRFAASKLYQI